MCERVRLVCAAFARVLTCFVFVSFVEKEIPQSSLTL